MVGGWGVFLNPRLVDKESSTKWSLVEKSSGISECNLTPKERLLGQGHHRNDPKVTEAAVVSLELLRGFPGNDAGEASS